MNLSREKVIFRLASFFVAQFPIDEVFATRLAINTVDTLEKELAKDVPEQIG